MVTNRQKQVGIIAFAIILLLLFDYNVHQSVRVHHLQEKPGHDNHSSDPLEHLASPNATDTTNDTTSTDFYDHLKGQLASLIEAGILGATAAKSEATTTSGDASVTDAAPSVDTNIQNYIFDLLNLNTATSMETFPAIVETVRLPTSTWMGEEDSIPDIWPTVTSEAMDTTPTVSASYAIISDLSFETATPKPKDHEYSRALVIARTSKEDITWIDDVFGESSFLQKAIYTVDNPVEPYILPANKGHEVMAYLTFIIDFYDNLPEVSIFLHAHLTAWHNNELLNMSSAEMLKNLNYRKVVREGYVNLRCHRYPSCPDHLFPIAKNNSEWSIPEEARFADAWMELLPHEEVPEVVSQPCCGQFAVSRERIHILPKAQYEHFRRWLMYTTLEDRVSGRVWEYIYQYIWLGVTQLCPKEHACYCDLYGVCFGGETDYEDYYAKKAHVDLLKQMSSHQREAGGNATWPFDYAAMIEAAQEAVKMDLRNAFLRGSDPYNRAVEMGRPFEPGDGF